MSEVIPDETPVRPLEFIGGFSVRVYHSCEGGSGRYEAVIPELSCIFTGMDVAHVLSNACQGLIYSLYEQERRMAQVRPTRATRRLKKT